MFARLRRRRFTIGVAAVLLIAVAGFFLAPEYRLAEGLRERAFDTLGYMLPRRQAEDRVVVIDIDRASGAVAGLWPWPRARLARLIERIAAEKPAAIVLDILVGGGAEEETAGRERMVKALGLAPAVLGMVLDPGVEAVAPGEPPVGTPILIGTPVQLGGMLESFTVAAPPAQFREAAKGLGILSLGAADSPIVRGVPLLGVGGERVYPGLAVEAVRVANGVEALIVAGSPPMLRIGDLAVPLDATASLRLHFTAEAQRRDRTITARDFLDGRGDTPIAGRVVVLGSSSPDIALRRITPVDPYGSSADIQATAIEQLLAGAILLRPSWAGPVEIAAAFGLGLVGLAAVLALPPATALALGFGAALLWAIGAVAAFQGGLLIDPASPPLAGLFVFQGVALAAFTETRRQRADIERRFAQHLPPEVVKRIAENPDIVRLEGEERTVTALFTDIEGFTALGERASPRQLVRLLDTYVERCCAVIIEHGGTVDKIVGDAVHAFFNAPIDLPDHARKAVICALALLEVTEKLRQEPLPRELGLGRTRIGIETGPAIVGNVGGGRRFDYTAHGPAVNTAAKLEAANKRFGSSIAIGPNTASQIEGIPLRPLGPVMPSASSVPILACEPWPAARPGDAALYREAFEAVARERTRAAALFDALAARYPDDAVLEQWRERLGTRGDDSIVT